MSARSPARWHLLIWRAAKEVATLSRGVGAEGAWIAGAELAVSGIAVSAIAVSRISSTGLVGEYCRLPGGYPGLPGQCLGDGLVGTYLGVDGLDGLDGLNGVYRRADW